MKTIMIRILVVVIILHFSDKIAEMSRIDIQLSYQIIRFK